MFEKILVLIKHFLCFCISNFLLSEIFIHLCNLPYVDVEFYHLFFTSLFCLMNFFYLLVFISDVRRIFCELKKNK